MGKYIVLSNLKHDRKQYKPGYTVELEGKPATRLVELSVVEAIEEKASNEPKTLEQMSKAELEEYGRTIGFEVDKRKTQKDIVADIKAFEASK